MTRSSILTLKNTELKLGSEIELPFEFEIVPCSIGIMKNVTINGLRLCRGQETSQVVRNSNSKVKQKHKNVDFRPPPDNILSDRIR